MRSVAIDQLLPYRFYSLYDGLLPARDYGWLFGQNVMEMKPNCILRPLNRLPEYIIMETGTVFKLMMVIG